MALWHKRGFWKQDKSSFPSQLYHLLAGWPQTDDITYAQCHIPSVLVYKSTHCSLLPSMVKKIKSRKILKGLTNAGTQFMLSRLAFSGFLWCQPQGMATVTHGSLDLGLPALKWENKPSVACHAFRYRRRANVSSLNENPWKKRKHSLPTTGWEDRTLRYQSHYYKRSSQQLLPTCSGQSAQCCDRYRAVRAVSCHLLKACSFFFFFFTSCQELLCSQIYLWFSYHRRMLTESILNTWLPVLQRVPY